MRKHYSKYVLYFLRFGVRKVSNS